MTSPKSFHWSVYAVVIIICIRLIIDAIICHLQNASYIATNIDPDLDYPLKIFLDLIAIVSFLLLIIEKSIFDYIILVLILICKLLFCVHQGTDISYAYLVGANSSSFIIEILPLTAVLFVKKGGESGWSILSSRKSGMSNSNKKKYCILLSIIGILTLFVITINSKEYPDVVNTFSKKTSVFLRLPNNNLARICLQKAEEAEDSGLLEKSDYYIEWCNEMSPTDNEIIDGIARYYNNKKNYREALVWYEKALNNDQNDRYFQTSYALCLSYLDLEAAVPYAENLIEEDPSNDIATCILRDYYYQVERYELAFYWGLRAFCLKETQQSDIDLENFSKVLSKKICATNYHISDNTLILSISVDEQPIVGLSNKEYLERIEKIQEKGILTLFMHNRMDIEIQDDIYYFIYLPGSLQGEIWHSDKVKRDLNRLFLDYPGVVISSLLVVK